MVFAVSFAAVLLLGVGVFLLAGDGFGPAAGDVELSSDAEVFSSIVSQLPAEFDPQHASSLLAVEGDPEEVATQYLDSRIPLVEAGVVGLEEQGGYTLVQWAWGELLTDDAPSESGESGWLILRPVADGYEVVAATTDGVDLSQISLTDGMVRGVVQSDTGELIGADVLNLDGSPVDSAPFPDGFFPDAMSRWGTAGADSPPLAIDVAVSGSVIIRVNRVGGTLLSISEVILGSAGSEITEQPEAAGPPLSDQVFQEVFGFEPPGSVDRESAFLAHSSHQDDLGVFSLIGARANSIGGVEFDQEVNCIVEHGMDGGVGGSTCGPDISLDKPGIALSSSCVSPNVTMFSAWAINPEVEQYELVFSDETTMLLEPNRGYVIWAWENTKHLIDIRADKASEEVQQAIDDTTSDLAASPCE